MLSIRPLILELFNETLKSSIYTLKRIGDKIPPYLTPLGTLKHGNKHYPTGCTFLMCEPNKYSNNKQWTLSITFVK